MYFSRADDGINMIGIACQSTQLTAKFVELRIDVCVRYTSENTRLSRIVSRLTKISLGTILRWHQQRSLTGTTGPGFFIARSRGINWRELIKRYKLDAAC